MDSGLMGTIDRRHPAAPDSFLYHEFFKRAPDH
jgi:hypothetical protein